MGIDPVLSPVDEGANTFDHKHEIRGQRRSTPGHLLVRPLAVTAAQHPAAIKSRSTTNRGWKPLLPGEHMRKWNSPGFSKPSAIHETVVRPRFEHLHVLQMLNPL